jgi:hypothetical protein
MQIRIVLIAVIAFVIIGFGSAQPSSTPFISGQSSDPTKVPVFSRKLIIAVKPLEPFVMQRGDQLEGFGNQARLPYSRWSV